MSFFEPVKAFVIMLAIAFSLALGAQAPADDRTPAELTERIDELENQGKYKEAIPLAEQLVVLARKARGDQDAGTAVSINTLAVLYERTREYAKAESLFKEALAIQQKVLGSEHPDVATSLNNLAELYESMGAYAKAEPLLVEALRIHQKVLGSEHPDTATSLDNLGALFLDMGAYAKAEPLFKKALEIRQKVLGPSSLDTAISLNNLAALYERLGEYAKAEPLYKQALEILGKVVGRDNPNTATALNNLALVYADMGDYAKAEPLYQQALEIDQRVLGRNHPDTATDLHSLALFYADLGEYAKAEPLFKEALEIRQKVLGRESPLTALSLNNLGLLYHETGDYAKAEPLYEEALEIRRKVLGRGHPDIAISLNNLASLFQQMGDYSKAEPLYNEALQIRQNVFGREHPDTAQSLSNLASLFQQTGDYSKAEPLLRDALDILQTMFGPGHPSTVKSIDNMALLELELGKIQEAKRLAQLANAADLKTFSEVLSFGSEDQRFAYQRLLNPYLLFAAVGESDTQLAGAVLHYKGVVLDSIIEDRLLAETSKAEANREQVEELKSKKRALAQLMLQANASAPSEAAQRIQALEQDVEGLQDKLARQLTDIGQARRALTVTVEQVEAALPKNSILVEYVRYDHYLGKSKYEWRYGAVVLSANVPPHWVTLGNAQHIEASLHRYQRLVRMASDDEMAPTLHEVYNEVWEPVERVLQANVDTVIISPDGQLNFLSFATLLDPDKLFVGEKYSIRYVASGRDLLRERQPSQSKQVIVMANPKFGKDLRGSDQVASTEPPTEGSGVLRGTEKREIQDLRFDEIGGTQRESAQLLPKFERWGWPAKSLAGADVTKQALLNLHGPYILHLATHGFFEPEDLSSDPNPAEPQALGITSDLTKSRFFKNPMHRSGLALAGANTTIEAWKRGEAPPIEDDGILTAEDVSTLDLKGTWLVTLSACDTGSGEARAGEGVMGLRRGFVEAGAQNLLMTLWPISDEVTVQIMSDFYEAAHESGSAPEALAKVQREWLVKLRKEQGLANAVNLAGPFIMSSQGKP
jgi:tetratricopeptide (TPR) repeat protein